MPLARVTRWNRIYVPESAEFFTCLTHFIERIIRGPQPALTSRISTLGTSVGLNPLSMFPCKTVRWYTSGRGAVTEMIPPKVATVVLAARRTDGKRLRRDGFERSLP